MAGPRQGRGAADGCKGRGGAGPERDCAERACDWQRSRALLRAAGGRGQMRALLQRRGRRICVSRAQPGARLGRGRSSQAGVLRRTGAASLAENAGRGPRWDDELLRALQAGQGASPETMPGGAAPTEAGVSAARQRARRAMAHQRQQRSWAFRSSGATSFFFCFCALVSLEILFFCVCWLASVCRSVFIFFEKLFKTKENLFENPSLVF